MGRRHLIGLPHVVVVPNPVRLLHPPPSRTLVMCSVCPASLVHVVQIVCSNVSLHLKAALHWRANVRDALSGAPGTKRSSVGDLESLVSEGERLLVSGVAWFPLLPPPDPTPPTPIVVCSIVKRAVRFHQQLLWVHIMGGAIRCVRV